MSFWNLFASKKVDPVTTPNERLLRHGRIAEGRVIDSDGARLDEITQIFYIYTVSGSDYESSHVLTAEQRLRHTEYAPGAKVLIRYDPRQPGNSIVV